MHIVNEHRGIETSVMTVVSLELIKFKYCAQVKKLCGEWRYYGKECCVIGKKLGAR